MENYTLESVLLLARIWARARLSAPGHHSRRGVAIYGILFNPTLNLTAHAVFERVCLQDLADIGPAQQTCVRLIAHCLGRPCAARPIVLRTLRPPPSASAVSAAARDNDWSLLCVRCHCDARPQRALAVRSDWDAALPPEEDRSVLDVVHRSTRRNGQAQWEYWLQLPPARRGRRALPVVTLDY